jgi:hypothetical protein
MAADYFNTSSGVAVALPFNPACITDCSAGYVSMQ